mgnify:FL=1
MKYRSIFISDLHLGIKHAQVSEFLDFIKENQCENLYLVGDFIDGWALQRKWFWSADCNTIIQKILRLMRQRDTKIYYIIGNHDDFLENFRGLHFGNLEICQEKIHESKKGKKFLVIHGHQFDGFLKHNIWLQKLGAFLYEILLTINYRFNKIRRRLGMRYWSLSNYLKQQTKKAVNFINDFEKTMIYFADKKECDGVICGHIHKPEYKNIDNKIYLNCGDWIENCTALVEHNNGEFSLKKY